MISTSKEKFCCFYPTSLIFRDNAFSTNRIIIFFFINFLFHFFSLNLKVQKKKCLVVKSKNTFFNGGMLRLNIYYRIRIIPEIHSSLFINSVPVLISNYHFCSWYYVEFREMHMNLNILISDKLLQQNTGTHETKGDYHPNCQSLDLGKSNEHLHVLCLSNMLWEKTQLPITDINTI